MGFEHIRLDVAVSAVLFLVKVAHGCPGSPWEKEEFLTWSACLVRMVADRLGIERWFKGVEYGIIHVRITLKCAFVGAR